MSKKISLDADYLLDELIWPATRYCIGRHSYVSSYAREYWNIIRQHRDSFDEERLQFYARDVKAEISNDMNWWDNVRTVESFNSTINFDSYYLLSKYLCEHPDCDFANTDFTINCLNGEIETSEREKSVTIYQNSMPQHSLAEWSKLASSIADQLSVVIKNAEGKEENVNVIAFYDTVRYDVNEPWRWKRELLLTECWNKMVPPEIIL